MIAKHHQITLHRQCDLLEVSRSGLYYQPTRDPDRVAEEKQILDAMDILFTDHPTLGRRGMSDALAEQYGLLVNPKRTRRLMRVLGLAAIYPQKKINTSLPNKEHEKYPYLLRGMEITTPNQVWVSDITYIRVKHGFCYLTVIMDWYSRCVLSWRVSNTLDSTFCVEALEEAIAKYGTPDIFNTDQGSQYTSEAFIGALSKHASIQISMDGVGRAYDNIMVERLWRTVKYEDVYLRGYGSPLEVRQGLEQYFHYYNHLRRHSSLGKNTPARIYRGEAMPQIAGRIQLSAKTPTPCVKNMML